MMRIRLMFTSLGLVLLLASQGVSQNVMRENFAYLAGKYITGLGGATNGWLNTWRLDPGDAGVNDSLLWVSDTGIVFSALPYQYNHAGSILYGARPADKYTRMERRLGKIWTPDSGTTFWFSVFMQLYNDTNSATWAGVKLCDSTHTDNAVMFGKGHGMDYYTCGGGWHGGPGPEVSSTRWDVGPVWLVGEFFNNGAGNQNLVYMWINPDPSAAPDTANADAKTTEALTPGIVDVRIEYGGGCAFEMGISDLRFGTTFASVSDPVVTPGHRVTEKFNYTVATDNYSTGLGTLENGWAGPWRMDVGDAGVSDSLFWVSSTGINYGSMPFQYAHGGNILYGSRPADKYSRIERQLDKVWTPDSGTTYWFGVFMELQNDTNSATWAGVKLCDNTHTDNAVMFGKGHGMDYYTCGGGWHGGPGPEVSSTRWDVGPVWLVGQIFNKGAGNQNLAYMWINPDPSAAPDTANADAKTTEALTPGIGWVRIEYGGGCAFSAAFSDLNLGTSFSDVITGVNLIPDLRPTEYALSQNYPNPFNPTTRIQYNVPKNGFVTLRVYNILGQVVATLYSGQRTAGIHYATFDGSKFASGVYFYRLDAGTTTMTKKMVLMK